MKCKNVQKNLIAYFEKDLKPTLDKEIRKHIESCAECNKHSRKVADFYNTSVQFSDLNSPSYSWEKLYLRILESEQAINIVGKTTDFILRKAFVPLTVAILSGGIMIGLHLGNRELQNNPEEYTFQEVYFESSYLNAFDPLPSNSIGGIYTTFDYNQPE